MDVEAHTAHASIECGLSFPPFLCCPHFSPPLPQCLPPLLPLPLHSTTLRFVHFLIPSPTTTQWRYPTEPRCSTSWRLGDQHCLSHSLSLHLRYVIAFLSHSAPSHRSDVPRQRSDADRYTRTAHCNLPSLTISPTTIPNASAFPGCSCRCRSSPSDYYSGCSYPTSPSTSSPHPLSSDCARCTPRLSHL